MNILMVSHGYPPSISGVTLVVQKLARAMVQRGHDVRLITASERGAGYWDEDNGVKLFRVRSLPNPVWQEGPIPLRLGNDELDVLDHFRPNLIHVHEAGLLGLQISLLARRKQIPLLATCYYVPRFVARYLGWNQASHRWVERLTWNYSTWFFNRFDQVVFATQTHRAAFIERGLVARTAIISNGVDLGRYHPAGPSSKSDPLIQRYQLPSGFRILFVGRLAQDKEIDLLIEAMARVCSVHPAHLLIVGRGDDAERLERLVGKLGLEAQVHFLGFVPEADLPALYRAVDVFAIASTCEVQSLPTLQALATGLPVVAVEAMALPELVQHRINGLLVPPRNPDAFASALLDLLAAPEWATRLGRVGLAIVQPHGDRLTFDQYEALYHQYE